MYIFIGCDLLLSVAVWVLIWLSTNLPRMIQNDLKVCLCLFFSPLLIASISTDRSPPRRSDSNARRLWAVTYVTNHRSSRLAPDQCIMTGNWLCAIPPAPPAELQRYDQSWGADVRLGNGGSSLELNCAPERRKCSFRYQMERSEETDNSVITSAVIRATGRGRSDKICGLLEDPALLLGHWKVCLDSVFSLFTIASVSFHLAHGYYSFMVLSFLILSRGFVNSVLLVRLDLTATYLEFSSHDSNSFP